MDAGYVLHSGVARVAASRRGQTRPAGARSCGDLSEAHTHLHVLPGTQSAQRIRRMRCYPIESGPGGKAGWPESRRSGRRASQPRPPMCALRLGRNPYLESEKVGSKMVPASVGSSVRESLKRRRPCLTQTAGRTSLMGAIRADIASGPHVPRRPVCHRRSYRTTGTLV